MVLSYREGGAGASGAPRSPSDDHGSQTLEFALLLPLAAFLVVLGLHAGVLAVDLVAVQSLAREAARSAAVAQDDEVRDAVEKAAGGQPVELDLQPGGPRPVGSLVTAEVRVQSRAFRPFGPPIWLPARATMRVEDA